MKSIVTCALDQVPKGCYGADAAAHGCIHLGRSAHNRPCHWITDNGRMDSSYPEIHNNFYNFCHYFSRRSEYSTRLHKWWSVFRVWNRLSFRSEEESCFRAHQLIAGKVSIIKWHTTLFFILCRQNRSLHLKVWRKVQIRWPGYQFYITTLISQGMVKGREMLISQLAGYGYTFWNFNTFISGDIRLERCAQF